MKKKRTCQIVNFAVPADHKVKLKESKFCERTEKPMEYESDVDTYYN